jgi:hypothetical protein
MAAGALQGQAFKEVFPARRIFVFCVITSLLPDADNFVGLGNPAFCLIHHRGITHSILAAFVNESGEWVEYTYRRPRKSEIHSAYRMMASEGGRILRGVRGEPLMCQVLSILTTRQYCL